MSDIRDDIYTTITWAQHAIAERHLRGGLTDADEAEQSEAVGRVAKWLHGAAEWEPDMQKTAMQQYLAGYTSIVATRDEWNQRYVDGWNDGNSDAKGDGEQICTVCDGDGEIEDHSHVSPSVDGDWPMVQCWRCTGTGVEPQEDA